MVKNPPANAGDIRDMGSIPGLGRSPREGHGNPLQHSCLENPMDRGAWQATAHTVTEQEEGDAKDTLGQQIQIVLGSKLARKTNLLNVNL